MYRGEVLSEPSRSSRPVSRGHSLAEVNVIDCSDEQDVVAQVVSYICDLLRNSPSCRLKAVELANRVRDAFGTDLLSRIREDYLGLLNLLEEYPQYFIVYSLIQD